MSITKTKMICPYKPVVTHVPQNYDGYVLKYARDVTTFGNCDMNKCPFYSLDGKCGRVFKDLKEG